MAGSLFTIQTEEPITAWCKPATSFSVIDVIEEKETAVGIGTTRTQRRYVAVSIDGELEWVEIPPPRRK